MNVVRWSEALLAFSLQATVIIAVTEVISRRLRTSRGRDSLWNLCFLSLLMVPVVGTVFPHLRLISAPNTVRIAEHSDPEGALTTFSYAVVLIWGLGSVLLIGRLIRDAFVLWKLLRHSTPLAGMVFGELQARLQTSDSQGEITPRAWVIDGKPLQIVVSGGVSTACCCQLQTPTILVPVELLRLSIDDLVFVIRHEIAHLRAGHPLKLLIQRCVAAVFWFHPAVWWACRQAVLTREFVCDEASVESKSAAARYLRVILRLLMDRTMQIPSGAVGLGVYRGLLAKRAERLTNLEWDHDVPFDRKRWMAILGVLSMSAILTLWIPLGDSLSFRSFWSPWPATTAEFLHAAGIPARDYEIDGHRFRPQERSKNQFMVSPKESSPP